jgi:hypothetical protein
MQMLAFVTTCGIGYLFWRHVWSFRKPTRKIPSECSGILTPAYDSIVYMKEVSPSEEVIKTDQGLRARVRKDWTDVPGLRQLQKRSELEEAI